MTSVDFGNVAEWAGVGVNGAVAIAAIIGLRHARADARRAEDRASKAEQELATDRAKREHARRARVEFEHVSTLLALHEAATPNVVLSPLEMGKIRAALALLPAGRLPKTRRYFTASPPAPTRQEVSDELAAEVQQLLATASET